MAIYYFTVHCNGVARLGKLVWPIDCFNRMLDCSIRVSRSFCNIGGSTQQAFGGGLGLARPSLGYATDYLNRGVRNKEILPTRFQDFQEISRFP